MNTQADYVASGAGESQESKILAYLQDHLGEWVGLPKLMEVSGSCVIHSRASSLRKKGINILNKTERVNGQTQSFYKLATP